MNIDPFCPIGGGFKGRPLSEAEGHGEHDQADAARDQQSQTRRMIQHHAVQRRRRRLDETGGRQHQVLARAIALAPEQMQRQDARGHRQ